MTNNDTLATALRPLYLQTIADAYAPEDCDQCEGRGDTCWECARDALDDAGFSPSY